MVVHYKYADPLLEIPKLKRSAEISHWGSNLNIQDEIWLRNAGPQYAERYFTAHSRMLILWIADSMDNSLVSSTCNKTITGSTLPT